MNITGLSGLLSSQGTREVTLSCALSLCFHKFQLKHYAQRELEIVRKRGNLKTAVADLIDILSDSELEEDHKKMMLEGLKAAVTDLATRDSYAYGTESIEFSMSERGKATDLYLCSDIESIELAEALLSSTSLTDEDHEEIDKAIYWAKELDLIKKPDSL